MVFKTWRFVLSKIRLSVYQKFDKNRLFFALYSLLVAYSEYELFIRCLYALGESPVTFLNVLEKFDKLLKPVNSAIDS